VEVLSAATQCRWRSAPTTTPISARTCRTSCTSFDGIAAGPDGNVWFGEFHHIAKITPAGKITEFAYPSQSDPNQYGGVTAGSDGNVWFAQSSENAIGRIVPSTGKIKMFPIPVSCTPAAVVLAKDKNVWLFCLASSPMLGRVTPAGKIKTFPIGGNFGSNETEQFCEHGPDGEPWCASGDLNTVFRVNTSSQTVTTFKPPLLSGARPDAVTAGSDGNIWVDTVGGQIDVLLNP
jgi:virginiamycin B lyase